MQVQVLSPALQQHPDLATSQGAFVYPPPVPALGLTIGIICDTIAVAHIDHRIFGGAEMKRDTRSSGSIYGEAEMSDDRMCMATFQLSAIQGEKYICGAHISITDKAKRELWADDIFQFLDTVYDGSGELRSFQDMSIAPCLWYVTYDGEQPESLEELDVRKVYVVSVFRHDHGLKMAGIARRKVLPDETNRSANIELRHNVKAALYEHIFIKP